MNKKISLGLTFTLIAAAVVVSAAAAVFLSLRVFNKIIIDLPAREASYKFLTEADNIIRTNYYGDVDPELAGEGQVSGYLRALPLGTNYYMDPDEYSEYKRDLSSSGSVTFETYASAGYIKINSFTDGTAKEFRHAVDELSAKNATSVIIDLRGLQSINTEGAARVIDEIAPIASAGTGVIASAVNRDGETIASFSSDADSISLPMAVLINGKTGGAAELLACDVRDFGKGIIVGEKSMGSGGYQQIFELSDGGAITLTTGVIIPYSSDTYDGEGVTPDFTVKNQGEDTGNLSDDEQFMKAYTEVS